MCSLKLRFPCSIYPLVSESIGLALFTFSPDDSGVSAPGTKLKEILLYFNNWKDGYSCSGLVCLVDELGGALLQCLLFCEG